MLAAASKSVPVVFAISKDPVGSGIAASLSRPGGDATGLTDLSHGLAAKRLQLLHETIPRVAHVGLLFDPADVGSISQVKEVMEAATQLRIKVTPIELGQAANLEQPFRRGATLGVQAYTIADGPLSSSQLQFLADSTLRARVPAIFTNARYAEAGGLMAYAPSLQDNFRRAAAYADKILKGAKPGDLPVEQPIKFELVINLKTAKALGLTIPQSVLARANEVIR